ncbi:cyclic nucleotide-binding domain-containing protein [Methylomagnum sp.]
MSAAPTPNETQDLRRLIPLNTLSAQRFDELCAALKIEDAPKGTALFHQGDATSEFVYLLSGTISLQAGGVEMDSVSSGTDVARFALAHQNPRKVAAIAKDAIRFVRIATELVYPKEEVRIPPPEAKATELSESSETDWMSSLLRSPIFQRLPPANLQAVLRAIQEVKVKAGDVIFHQDDAGDYFYIIKHGQCSLTRKPSANAKEIKLATLKSRDTFGEDALISEQPRTLTVTMDTHGELMRLDKANFLKLVSDPVIGKLSAKEAIEVIKQGGIWLDVRMPDQYQHGQPRGPLIRAPFFSLRMMLTSLDRGKKYIAVCETGKISEAAAYLLLRFRFNAQVLKGGIDSLPPDEIIAELAEPTPEPEPKHELRLEALDGLDEPEIVLTDVPVAPPPAEEEAPPIASDGDSRRSPIPLPPDQDQRRLESRLTRLIAEKEKADAELQQARLATHKLQTALTEMQKERDQLLQQYATSSAVMPPAREAVPEDDLRQELEDLKARYSQTVFEKDFAGQEVQNLEKQVGDLKAMVEDFMEQGGYTADAEVEALRAELEMVREQAGSELIALQTRASEAEAAKARLETDLQLAKVQLSVREAASEEDERPPEKPSLIPAILGGAAVGFLLAALMVGALFGLPAGRDLARSWVGGEPAPAVATTAPSPTPN